MASRVIKIEGLVCWVTGGGSGLGRATATRFVRGGAKVVICDLPKSHGENVAKELGDNCLFIPTDITDEDQVLAALEETKKKFGQLDVVVNCAGICIQGKTYNVDNNLPHSLEDVNTMLQVNASGNFNVIRLACTLMSQNVPNDDGQRGVIINTASIVAYEGPKGLAAYAASKGAVVGMTLPIARDLASIGIRVVAIAPGMFATPMNAAFSEEYIKSVIATIPFPKRLGHPDDYAHLAQSIVENPMINGEVIRIDGAMRL